MTKTNIAGGGSTFGDTDGAQAEADQRWLLEHGWKLGLGSAPDADRAERARPVTPTEDTQTGYSSPSETVITRRTWQDAAAQERASAAGPTQPDDAPETDAIKHFDLAELRRITTKLLEGAEAVQRGDRR